MIFVSLEMGLGLPRNLRREGGAGVETVRGLEWIELKESMGAAFQEPKHAEVHQRRDEVLGDRGFI